MVRVAMADDDGERRTPNPIETWNGRHRSRGERGIQWQAQVDDQPVSVALELHTAGADLACAAMDSGPHCPVTQASAHPAANSSRFGGGFIPGIQYRSKPRARSSPSRGTSQLRTNPLSS